MTDPIAAGTFGAALALAGALALATLVWPWIILPALTATLIAAD